MNNTFEINLRINGQTVALATTAEKSLLRLLRENNYWDVKCGCEEGDCGSCAVLLDGRAVKSCITLAAACNGREIWTNRGLGRTDELTKKLQAAFVESGAIQCGFCTCGMIIAAKHYLEQGGKADRSQIKEAISGNLCRCTGYVKIVDAVYGVALEMGTGGI
ncbi:MAG: (2Fe-2S)-binding protein [Clostridiales bacterium]|jgi:carbon-monoxide dehydrogenase small subunit|nr:(2Fe-2S)-binding protein [Clostridiales bacterium]